MCTLTLHVSLNRYGRVYTTDPYHALAPATSYGVGAVVSNRLFSNDDVNQLETKLLFKNASLFCLHVFVCSVY